MDEAMTSKSNLDRKIMSRGGFKSVTSRLLSEKDHKKSAKNDVTDLSFDLHLKST